MSSRSFSRREVIKTATTAAAVSALAGVSLPHVHAGENNTIDVALIGCGGRGTGAAENALNTKSGPIRLTAMADSYADRLNGSFETLKKKVESEERLQVKDDQKFVGYDAYQKAMDCLKPGDVALLATPPAFRWPMFQYAIKKGLHVFMEKPTTVDGPSTRKMLALAEESEKKNLKVGVGLMCRHCVVREELFDRVKQGEIGDVVMLRAYRQAGPTGLAFVKKRDPKQNELEYQIRNFHGFLWASGGAFSDFLIHNIDECCWIKDGWPVKAIGSGGRHFRKDYVDQNFDSYSVEFTYADGAKLFLEGRTMVGARNEFASYAHGSKGSAVISARGHTPAHSKIYRGQHMVRDNVIWDYKKKEPNPYQTEWDRLIEHIREDKPHNEAKRGAIASLITCMGRLACHTGQEISYDQMLNHDHEFAPTVDKLAPDSAAPVVADADGKYPWPEPGIKRTREY